MIGKKLSLIITVYNRFDLLIKSLFSIKNQYIKPYELIIADDGSSENISEHLRDYIEEFDFKIRYIYQKDNGFRLAKNRNNAVRISRGDFLFFIDQDIVLTRGYLKKIINNIQEKMFIVGYPIRLSEEESKKLTIDIIENNRFENFIDNKSRSKLKKQYRKELFYNILFKMKLRKIGTKVRGGLFAISKKDFYIVNGFDENYIGWGNEDDDICNRLYNAGVIGKNIFFDDEFAFHLFHPYNHDNGFRKNLEYYLNNKNKKSVECEKGVSESLSSDIYYFDLN